jgi:hypothetical protein
LYQNPNELLQKQLADLAKSFNQMPSPQLPNMSQPMTEQVKSVPGIAGAREYLKNMAASSSQVLMDETQNVFFLVRKDANGNPSPITVGHFTVEQEPPEESPYISKQDFEQFKAELWQKLNEKGATA